MKAKPISATWSESGNVILTVEITLPQKEISKPEALRICDQIGKLAHSERRGRKPTFTHSDYMDFVATLRVEGDDDIPSEDQWRSELEAAYTKGEI